MKPLLPPMSKSRALWPTIGPRVVPHRVAEPVSAIEDSAVMLSQASEPRIWRVPSDHALCFASTQQIDAISHKLPSTDPASPGSPRRSTMSASEGASAVERPPAAHVVGSVHRDDGSPLKADSQCAMPPSGLCWPVITIRTSLTVRGVLPGLGAASAGQRSDAV